MNGEGLYTFRFVSTDGFDMNNPRVSDFEEEPDTSYYEFPGGVEVRQISAHLMSFPSQIVQYASRSGRVDGNCKSEDVADKIRDFEKVIDFARWEIERLENEVKC